jgi:alkane 1-monooxygenase
MPASVYLLSLTVPMTVFVGLYFGGPWAWLTVAYVFVAVPLADIVFGRDSRNRDPQSEARAKSSRTYSFVLWAFLPIQAALVFAFGRAWMSDEPSVFVRVGWALSTALSCGGIGISVAHELVHRRSRAEQWVGRLLLTTVLYMHFAIEHVRGHHLAVATAEDAATARRGESVYRFLLPSIFGQIVSAWRLEIQRLAARGRGAWSLQNEMLWFAVIQAAWLALLAFVFGALFLPAYLVVAVVSFTILEVVNYIEHYGLERRRLANGRYETVEVHHSWNSDHLVSRMMLFELTRHSDHHAMASKPYQALRSADSAPQLPTGYPGMVLVALVPPLWFRIMHACMPAV